MPDPLGSPSPITLPVIEEHLEIERRRVDRGGVRVTRHVDTESVPVDATLAQESVRIERVPVGRALADDEHPQPRIDGDTVIVPVIEETLVVDVRRVLREEVHVIRERHTTQSRQTVTLRRDRIGTETLEPAPVGTGGGPGDAGS